MKAVSIASFVLTCITPGSAKNDSNVYGSYSNPNAVYSHYRADAVNVLQDLSSFKHLYVKYHNCA